MIIPDRAFIIFLSFFCLINVSPVLAEDGVYVSGNYSNRYQQKRVEEDVQRIALKAYQSYVDELIRKSLTPPKLSIPVVMVDQAVRQATLETLRRPEIQKTIREVFVVGVQIAIEQIKLKATRRVMEQKIQAAVDQDIKKVAREPSFQQSLDKIIRETVNQQSQTDLQQAFSQQQAQSKQQQASFQQSIDQQFQKAIEQIKKEKK